MEDDKLMYVHPAPVRVWHWVNAVGFIVLILTGIQIRFAEMVDWFSLEEAIKLHNYVGFVIIASSCRTIFKDHIKFIYIYYYKHTHGPKSYFFGHVYWNKFTYHDFSYLDSL